MRLLITGGCGFIGTNFIKLLFQEKPNTFVVNLDKLTYAGNPTNLTDIAKAYPQNYIFAHGCITDKNLLQNLTQTHAFDAILNFAAESHVDRSISDATPFITTNILGTQTLLDVARTMNIPRFIQISTDEVYGSLGPEGKFTEQTMLAPNSPYSASKAGADMLVRAAHKTHGLHTIITRCSNNYGPYQFPEKLIPLIIHQASTDKPLPVYGDGMQIRDWIHVEDHCRGILLALEKGLPGTIYNFGGNSEQYNIIVVKEILRLLNKPETLIKYVHDRPGHDRRYAMDFSYAAKELGYTPKIPFEIGLEKTISWYVSNNEWIQSILSGSYRDFMPSWYGECL